MVPDEEDLQPGDRVALAAIGSTARRVPTTAEALAASRPAVALDADAPLRLLSRVGPRGAVVHVLGRA